MTGFPPHGLIEAARALLAEAQAKGVMIATAESCTGGLITAALTEIPGSSKVFDRGFITYSYEAKHEMLGVPWPLIRSRGAVSQEVAIAMAEGALARSQAALAVAITGVAGPGGIKRKPPGLVHFALAGRDLETQHEVRRFGDIGRAEVRLQSALTGIALLRAGLGRLQG